MYNISMEKNMEEKETHQHSHDGIDNSEHVLDMQKQIEVLIENIQDNTDSAFSLLKLHENDKDQDIVDVYRINCSNILDCEKLASDLQKEFNSIVSLVEGDSKKVLAHLERLEDLIDKIKNYEEKSIKEFATFLQKIKE